MNERVLNAAVVTAALAFGPATAFAAPAPDGPGVMSHFALARKDCVGTAQNERSKVWFTVADGVLERRLLPDQRQHRERDAAVRRDGRQTFTDLQTRDMTYTVQALDKRALTCRVTATAKSGKYRIVTDFLTDPDRPTVILHSRFEALKGRTKDYSVYVRFDPNLNGNGGGGAGNGGADTGARRSGNVLVGSDTVTATNAANRDYAQPVFSALDAARLHPGLQRLRGRRERRPHAARRRPAGSPPPTPTPRPATSCRPARSTSAATGRSRSRSASARPQAAAVSARAARSRTPLWLTALEYLVGWHRYDHDLVEPRRPQAASAATTGTSCSTRTT